MAGEFVLGMQRRKSLSILARRFGFDNQVGPRVGLISDAESYVNLARPARRVEWRYVRLATGRDGVAETH